jgi:hypothetical protein
MDDRITDDQISSSGIDLNMKYHDIFENLKKQDQPRMVVFTTVLPVN